MPKFFFPSTLSSHYHLATEIEGLFNILYAHILSLWLIDSPEALLSHLQPQSPRSSTACAFPPRYGVFKPSLLISFRLTNFFKTLLDLASTNDELHVLQVSRADVEKRPKE